MIKQYVKKISYLPSSLKNYVNYSLTMGLIYSYFNIFQDFTSRLHIICDTSNTSTTPKKRTSSLSYYYFYYIIIFICLKYIVLITQVLSYFVLYSQAIVLTYCFRRLSFNLQNCRCYGLARSWYSKTPYNTIIYVYLLAGLAVANIDNAVVGLGDTRYSEWMIRNKTTH